jgi:hypothetical protein
MGGRRNREIQTAKKNLFKMMSNKLYYPFVGMLLSVIIILLNEVLSLKNVPDEATFSVHLNTLNVAAGKLRNSCHESYKKGREAGMKPSNADMARTFATFDRITSFSDSADYYFHRLKLSRNDPDSARQYFAKYTRLFNRFAAAINEIQGMPVNDTTHYLLKLQKDLPGKDLPFESEPGIILLALLVEIDFYDRMGFAMNRLGPFPNHSDL